MPTPPDRDQPRRLAADLVPHGVAARLLTEIVRHEPGFIEAIGEIPARYPLATASGAPCFLGLELAAQAAAALHALMRVADDGPARRVGYLVRIREASFLRPELPTGTPLGVTARLEEAVAPLGVHRVCVSVGGVDYLRAVISTLSELQ